MVFRWFSDGFLDRSLKRILVAMFFPKVHHGHGANYKKNIHLATGSKPEVPFL